MNEDDVDRLDRNRRHFLTVATAVAGAVGVGFAAVPFLSSLKPSARAQALGAPVEVPLGSMQPGEMVRVIWRGRLVFVLRRSEEMLARLQESVDNPTRPAPSGPSISSSKGRARTLAVRHSRILTSGRARTGTGASSAPAMVPSSTWRVAYTRVFRRPPTCGFLRTGLSGMT
jgi:ubiquinol-cytochrome c reductase iron-sulfur subunit